MVDVPWLFLDTRLLDTPVLAMLVKLLLAFIAGSLIGIEREKHGRPAGLRTHVLVCTASCLMMVISEGLYLKYAHLMADSAVRLDPGRIGAQIIAGIGFLGAGVILKEGVSIRGLTTAACLWFAAGVGMAFGAGMFLTGGFATALALVALMAMKKLEPVIKKDRFLNLCVLCHAEVDLLPQLQQLFDEFHLRITDVEQELDLEHDRRRYTFVVTQHRQRIGHELLQRIVPLEGVLKVRYK